LFPRSADVVDALILALLRYEDPIPTQARDDNGQTVYDVVADYLHVPTDLRATIISDGTNRNKWQNVVQWARASAKESGWIDSFGHGRWGLTQNGKEYARTLVDSGSIEDAGVTESRRTTSADEYALRQKRAEEIGSWGEKHVLDQERLRLESAGRADLAARIQHIALTDVGAGFDVLSFEVDGAERRIEVKTTVGTSLGGFWLTERERRAAESFGASYFVYRVMRAETDEVSIVELRDLARHIEEGRLGLTPTQYWVTYADEPIEKSKA
jgi:hypothetical protein